MSFFLCLFALWNLLTEKRTDRCLHQIFDVFFSDWFKILINIHEKNRSPCRKSSRSSSCEGVSQGLKLYGALEAAWKTPARRTAKEKVAQKLQPKVRVASQKSYIYSVK